MSRRWLATALGLISLLALAAFASVPAQAAVAGVPDGNGHPSVGHIFGQLDPGSTCVAQVIANCVGVLIAPRVVVTTGECTDTFQNAAQGGFDLTATWVTFNPDNALDCGQAVRVQEFHFHPYDPTYKDPSGNVGVLILESDAPVAPATLPPADSVADLVRGTDFTGVTYGGEGNVTTDVRLAAATTLRSTNADAFRLRVEGRGCGSAYIGGGAFLESSWEVDGILLANAGCKNGNYLRLDSTTVRDFLAPYVTLP